MLILSEISKTFPGVKALDNVSLSFSEGKIHALLGENGAGKSTLIKTICGILKPDRGRLVYNNDELQFSNYKDAVKNGISLVSQEIQVIPESTIAENIFLEHLEKFRSFSGLNWKKLFAEAEIYMDLVGLNLKPEDKVGGLSGAQKKLVQIAKALSAEAGILLLDEPTATLTQHEVNHLFKILHDLKKRDMVMIFVSHKLDEVFQLCDEISVLRDGELIGSRDVSATDTDEIVKMMIGRETETEYLGELNHNTENVVLEAKDISSRGVIHNASFKLYSGEILGFYGLVGSGRTELARILIGADKHDSGDVFIRGKRVKICSVAEALDKYSLGYISENRKEEGLFLDESIQMNTGITILKRIKRFFNTTIFPLKEAELCTELISKLQIKTFGNRQEVGTLSGGNQQKVSFAKWLAADCDILIIDEPTIGVDVGAKEQIHHIIWDLAANHGKSVILISSDLPEMLTLARRILVFRDKRILGEVDELYNSQGDLNSGINQQIGSYLM